MGLFDFLKKKAKIDLDIDTEKDIRKIISCGVLFEDNKQFLKWGQPVEKLVETLDVKRKLFADRSVYIWGEHSILNGLKLELNTIFWNSPNKQESGYFYGIEYLSIGDEKAEEHLQDIKKHLEQQFGEPVVQETVGNDVSLRWKVNEVELSLYYFERYSNKLHFKIEKI